MKPGAGHERRAVAAQVVEAVVVSVEATRVKLGPCDPLGGRRASRTSSAVDAAPELFISMAWGHR